MSPPPPARWRLLPSGINVLLVSSAQRVGRVSHKTQGFRFINCRVYRVRESGGKSKLQNTGFPFYQLSSVQSVQSEREWWKE